MSEGLTPTAGAPEPRPHVSRHHRPRILFFAQEREEWRVARSVGYTAQLGFEEGFSANDVWSRTLTTPCFTRARELCANDRFDQVWIHVFPYRLDRLFWEWIRSVAPIRVGLVPESLRYTADEIAREPGLTRHHANFDAVKDCLTHVVAVDELDVDYIRRDVGLPALWWPQAIPRRYIDHDPPAPTRNVALFIGSAYDRRADILASSDLTGLLERNPSSEAGTPYGLVFDVLNRNVYRYLRRPWLPGAPLVVHGYLQALRWIRRQTFRRWLRSLQAGCAVVNLPSWVKAYAGRVVEAMAAGRPVISWEIQERPRTRALFTRDEEIFLFRAGDTAQLAAYVRRTIEDPEFTRRMVEAARRKVERWHTMERRVGEILNWLETGDVPSYS